MSEWESSDSCLNGSHLILSDGNKAQSWAVLLIETWILGLSNSKLTTKRLSACQSMEHLQYQYPSPDFEDALSRSQIQDLRLLHRGVLPPEQAPVRLLLSYFMLFFLLLVHLLVSEIVYLLLNI